MLALDFEDERLGEAIELSRGCRSAAPRQSSRQSARPPAARLESACRSRSRLHKFQLRAAPRRARAQVVRERAHGLSQVPQMSGGVMGYSSPLGHRSSAGAISDLGDGSAQRAFVAQRSGTRDVRWGLFPLGGMGPRLRPRRQARRRDRHRARRGGLPSMPVGVEGWPASALPGVVSRCTGPHGPPGSSSRPSSRQRRTYP